MSRADLPGGTVTFLFTDVEGSTRLLHELGSEGYAVVLAEHRRLLREAFRRHGGVEVDTQGDAFLFAFPTAEGALVGAEESRHALATSRVRVRMGLHTGEPFLGDEGYVGRDVHLGARIAASGHGGQVLVSQATRELAGDAFVDLGEHRLKDFPEPVWIFQLGSERFPPLKTISNTNLPRPVSAFVGREREKAELRSLLLNGSRLVTLSGPGGVGKTRLAVEVAAELVPEFKNGVYWVGLRALRDPALVPDTISQALGPGDDLAERVGERELLLVLDNFEQVVEAAPDLSALLSGCPNLRVLVTSRELLRVQGERDYPLPPMVEGDAVTLFCERSGLEPDDTVAELCAQLDELPLAIELAAARTSVLSPAQILTRLGERLDLFKGGRDVDPRQQTLRTTIEWSYDLLGPDEQWLFAALAVFAGGCTLEAAEEVCDADLDTLQSLRDKSLLRHTDERFWMLETIREYARERLLENDGEAALRRRHAACFLALAEHAEADGAQAEANARVVADQENFRRALEWARDLDENEILLRLMGALGGFWTTRGMYREAGEWLVLALDRSLSPIKARMRALRWAVIVAKDYDLDLARADALTEEWRWTAEECGDGYELMLATNMSARNAEARGDLHRAREGFGAVFDMAVAAGDRRMQAAMTVNFGLVAGYEGDHRSALEYAAEAAAIFRELGAESGLARAVGNCGWSALELGDTVRAGAYLREAIAIADRLGWIGGIAVTAVGLAAVLVTQHEEERAARLVGAAAAVRAELGIGFVDHQEERAHNQTVAAARAALGEDPFARAWARGQAMGPEDIVRLCAD